MNKKFIVFGICLFLFSEFHGIIYRYCFNVSNKVITKIIIQKDAEGKIISTYQEDITEEEEKTKHNVCQLFNEQERINILIDIALKCIAIIFTIIGVFFSCFCKIVALILSYVSKKK